MTRETWCIVGRWGFLQRVAGTKTAARQMAERRDRQHPETAPHEIVPLSDLLSAEDMQRVLERPEAR